jgi:hypothetical protein
VVYGRKFDDKILSFEPSGALREASLVMRDRETDSWWSIMSGSAVGGELEGVELSELPVGEKVRWAEWKERYPDTMVLSVDGEEHDPHNPYVEYFRDGHTFRSVKVKDPRLPGKEPIFVFRLDDHHYVVPHVAAEGGASIVIGEVEVFLYRKPRAELFESTHAYVVDAQLSTDECRIRIKEGVWIDTSSGASFSEDAGFPDNTEGMGKLTGFDTFWYSFANVNPGSVILVRQLELGANRLVVRQNKQ